MPPYGLARGILLVPGLSPEASAACSPFAHIMQRLPVWLQHGTQALGRALDRSLFCRIALASTIAGAVLMGLHAIDEQRSAPERCMLGPLCWEAIGVESIESFSILVVASLYLIESRDRRKRRHYEAWQVVDNAASANVPTSYARLQALQDLNEDGVSLRGLDVPGADLEGIRLPGADLREATLSETDLRKTHLVKANLQHATLTKADCREANLQDADLHGTRAAEARFSGAHLQKANLQAANLAGADLTEANLAGADLSRANLAATDFTGADLRGANLFGARVIEGSFKKAIFRGAQLAGATMPDGTVVAAARSGGNAARKTRKTNVS